jgi:hypothetical protein
MFGVLRLHQHEVCGGAADFRASSHQTKVLRFDMLAAHLKAMSHDHAETRLVATQTFLDASRGIPVIAIHGDVLAVATPIGATVSNAACSGLFQLPESALMTMFCCLKDFRKRNPPSFAG